MLLDYVMTSILMLIFFIVLKSSSDIEYETVLEFFKDEILTGDASCSFDFDTEYVSVTCCMMSDARKCSGMKSWVELLHDDLVKPAYMVKFEEMAIMWMSGEAEIAHGIFEL